MIIVHVLSSFDVGGQERMAVDLAVRQQDCGHAVHAVSLRGGERGPLSQAFEDGGVATHVVDKQGAFDWTLHARLTRLIAALRPDVVHTHNPQALIYGAPAGYLAGARVVHTKHGRNPDSLRRRALRRVCSAFCSAYVAVSESTASVARSARDCAPRKLLVIPNGIDVERFRRDPDASLAVRTELNIPRHAWVIGTVGRLAAEKDHALLIRAAAPLLGDACRLVLVGDGAERRLLVALAAALQVSRYVHFTGMRPDTERFMSAFDVFALSSVTEGLPLVVPEAMAAGLPIVSTAVGGIPDVLGNAELALLVPSGDEEALRSRLATLCADRDRARAMGAEARREAVLKYSSERMLTDYLELYDCVQQGRSWILSPSSGF